MIKWFELAVKLKPRTSVYGGYQPSVTENPKEYEHQ